MSARLNHQKLNSRRKTLLLLSNMLHTGFLLWKRCWRSVITEHRLQLLSMKRRFKLAQCLNWRFTLFKSFLIYNKLWAWWWRSDSAAKTGGFLLYFSCLSWTTPVFLNTHAHTRTHLCVFYSLIFFLRLSWLIGMPTQFPWRRKH